MERFEQNQYISKPNISQEIISGAYEATTQMEAANSPDFETRMDESAPITNVSEADMERSRNISFEETAQIPQYFNSDSGEAIIAYMTELDNCKQEILRIEEEISKYAKSSLLEKITHFIAGHDLETAWKNEIHKKKILEGKLAQQQNNTIYH